MTGKSGFQQAAGQLEPGMRAVSEAFRAAGVTMAEAARNYAENLPRLLEALRGAGYLQSLGQHDDEAPS